MLGRVAARLAGVPLVVVPGGGDQWEIANRVVRQGSAQLVRPLTAEARTARAVSNTNDYSLRAVPRSSDEVGTVVRAFKPHVIVAVMAALVARGMTNRQIAGELFISEKTAGVHVSNILAKLDVISRAQAAAVAVQSGVVSSAP